ncbi:MAG TPA: phosphotransferase [Acidimicrobiales bacterium]|jgi:aminoglycoside phosphotransferase (APT) family kinase protein|nr:phosphotransferase [Acidimicrobiales bacterium]
MQSLGPLLASGRDSDIFEYGPGLVLRRSREGHSMAQEARTMSFLHDRGYPVPAVDELSDDGFDLVMERIEGVSMVEAIGRAPWTVRRQAATLADLHLRLHEIDAPDFLPAAPAGSGNKVIHLDLHPLNVLVGPKGPFVIDWPNARRGDPDIDVGLAWVLMAAGQVPGNRLKAKLLALGRTLLVGGFLSHFDRDEVAGHLRPIVEVKVKDPHMSETEIAGMWKVVEQAEAARR